jgi:hypothetical protein
VHTKKGNYGGNQHHSPLPSRTKIDPGLRSAVIQKYPNRCAYCGKRIFKSNITVDHVLPRVRGGTETLENLLPACRDCNQHKGDQTLSEWRNDLENWHTIMHAMDPTYRALMRMGRIQAMNTPVRFYFEEAGVSATTVEELLSEIMP